MNVKSRETEIAEALARTAAGQVADRLEKLARNVRLRAAGFGGENLDTGTMTATIINEFHTMVGQAGMNLVHFVRAADDAQRSINGDLEAARRRAVGRCDEHP